MRLSLKITNCFVFHCLSLIRLNDRKLVLLYPHSLPRIDSETKIWLRFRDSDPALILFQLFLGGFVFLNCIPKDMQMTNCTQQHTPPERFFRHGFFACVTCYSRVTFLFFFPLLFTWTPSISFKHTMPSSQSPFVWGLCSRACFVIENRRHLPLACVGRVERWNRVGPSSSPANSLNNFFPFLFVV